MTNKIYVTSKEQFDELSKSNNNVVLLTTGQHDIMEAKIMYDQSKVSTEAYLANPNNREEALRIAASIESVCDVKNNYVSQETVMKKMKLNIQQFNDVLTTLNMFGLIHENRLNNKLRIKFLLTPDIRVKYSASIIEKNIIRLTTNLQALDSDIKLVEDKELKDKFKTLLKTTIDQLQSRIESY